MCVEEGWGAGQRQCMLGITLWAQELCPWSVGRGTFGDLFYDMIP